jgi:D-glycero-D-manno-heptose 1,7-bisphosphate phosphatase
MRRRLASEKVIVLDRDGTIVVDCNYLDDPSRLEFEPQAALGLRTLYAEGHRLVVITNQSGIGRGLFSEQRLREIHNRLDVMVESIGARLAGIYYCPHRPEDGCQCRKPQLALLTQAAAELGFEPSSAVVIGDKLSDVEFGKRAGATTILLASRAQATETATNPDYVVKDLLQAARIISELR